MQNWTFDNPTRVRIKLVYMYGCFSFFSPKDWKKVRNEKKTIKMCKISVIKCRRSLDTFRETNTSYHKSVIIIQWNKTNICCCRCWFFFLIEWDFWSYFVLKNEMEGSWMYINFKVKTNLNTKIHACNIVLMLVCVRARLLVYLSVFFRFPCDKSLNKT